MIVDTWLSLFVAPLSQKRKRGVCSLKKRFRAAPLFLIIALSCAAVASAEAPLSINAVVVTFWQLTGENGDPPGERNLWFQKGDFTEHLPFPLGEWDLGYNPENRTLLLTTGVGDIKAASSIMALGTDPRFDLSRAYFILCGIAGGDPLDISLGSVAVCRFVIDHDLSYFIDPREMPGEFSTGFLPIFRTQPYEEPMRESGELYRLNPYLARRALEIAKDVPLEESEGLLKKRALYAGFPKASKPPFVMIGDILSGNRFWHGEHSNEWANDWMRYFSKGEGNYVVTAMEDAGAMLAIQRLSQTGKADPERVVILRSVSNFAMQWKGASAYESLMSEGGDEYSSVVAAVNNVHAVGAAVLRGLLKEQKQ